MDWAVVILVQVFFFDMTVWKDRLALSSMVGFNRFTFRRARRVFKRFHKRASAYIAKGGRLRKRGVDSE